MSVSWEFFAKRRLKNNDGLRAWANTRNVTSYEELVEALNTNDVDPPTKEQVSFLFEDPQVRSERLRRGKATQRFAQDEPEKEVPKRSSKTSKNPREYGVYKAADQPSEEKT
jgi:hypothetical protein